MIKKLENLFTIFIMTTLLVVMVGCNSEEGGVEEAGGPGTNAEGLIMRPNTWVMTLSSHTPGGSYGSTKLRFEPIVGRATASGGVSGFISLEWETWVGSKKYYSGPGGWMYTGFEGDAFEGDWVAIKVRLVDGVTNKVIVKAKDQIGNTVSQHIFVAVDATAPVIKLTSPTGLKTTSTYWTNQSSITLVGSGTDNIGVTDLRWANLTNTTSGNLTPFAAFSQVINLDVGINNIELETEDAVANTRLYEYTVGRDISAPTLGFTGPTAGTTHYSNELTPPTITGWVADAGGAALKSLTWTNTATGESGTLAVGSPFAIAGINVIAGTNPIEVTALDHAGNETTGTYNYIVSLGAPQITAASFSIEGGASVVNSPFVTFDLQATGDFAPITDVCLQVNNKIAPGLSDPCWQAVTPTLNLNLVGASATIGKLSMPQDIYAFVRDQVNNVSFVTNGGNGTLGTDLYQLDLHYITEAPKMTGLIASNTNSPSSPITTGEMISISPLYIKWRVEDNETLVGSNIKLEWTEDLQNYTAITNNPMAHDYENLCTADDAGTAVDDGFTGCFRWASGYPANTTIFYIRASITDDTGQVAASTFGPFNSTQRIIAGEFDQGIGLHASALAYTQRNRNLTSSTSYWDPNSLVVNSKREIYLLDRYSGLLKIDPVTGITSSYIPVDEDSTAGLGDGGPATGATLKSPIKLAIDVHDNLYLLDYDRIRKINASNGFINTIIGGGTDDSATVLDPLQVKIWPFNLSTILWEYVATPLVIAPNGDIIFQDRPLYLFGTGSIPATNMRLRFYTASTGAVSEIRPNGTGHATNAAADVSVCRTWQSGFEYDPSGGSFDDAFFSTYNTTGQADCGINLYRVAVGTWTSTAPHFDGMGARKTYGRMLTGLDGKIYITSRVYSDVYKMNSDAGNWTKVHGVYNTIGTCADGTAKTSCASTINDIFVDKDGVMYILEDDRIRRVDASNQVRTVAGSLKSRTHDSSPDTIRLGQASWIDHWKDGTDWKYTLLDVSENKIFEILPNTELTHLAGNGNHGLSALGVDARTTPLYARYGGTHPQSIAVNRTNGDLYMGTNSTKSIEKLDRSTLQWSKVIGGGTTVVEDPLAEDEFGANLKGNGYGMHPLILEGNQLYVSYTKAGWESWHFMYDISDSYRQNQFAGIGPGSSTVTWCTVGTPTDSCKVGWYASKSRPSYDSFADAWHFPFAYASGGNRSIHVLNVGGLYDRTNLSEYPNAAVIFRDAVDHLVYYCDRYGQLRKRDVNNGPTEGFIDLDLPSTAVCNSRAMLRNPDTGTLIVPMKIMGNQVLMEMTAP